MTTVRPLTSLPPSPTKREGERLRGAAPEMTFGLMTFGLMTNLYFILIRGIHSHGSGSGTVRRDGDLNPGANGERGAILAASVDFLPGGGNEAVAVFAA